MLIPDTTDTVTVVNTNPAGTGFTGGGGCGGSGCAFECETVFAESLDDELFAGVSLALALRLGVVDTETVSDQMRAQLADASPPTRARTVRRCDLTSRLLDPQHGDGQHRGLLVEDDLEVLRQRPVDDAAAARLVEPD